MLSTIRSYGAFKLVIVGYDFHTAGGAWRSIYDYYKDAERRGETLRLIDRHNAHTFRQLVAAFFGARRVLFNGLGSLDRWEALLFCLLRPDAMIYLHETAYYLDRLAEGSAWRHRLVARILRRNPVLCVSEAAAALYRSRYGSRTHVVYETVPPPSRPQFAPGKKHLLMVGSVYARKGVDLFSRVADLAHAQGLPWEFHWLGALTTKEKLYFSPHVDWRGWSGNVGPFLEAADLFFLSSIDDPFPLACCEALMHGRRCVVYKETGLAEVLRDVAGCGVFDEYRPEKVLPVLEKSLREPLDEKTVARICRDTLSVESFGRRIDRVLDGFV